jgi:hypothetical protein
METASLRITLDQDCPVSEYLEDGIVDTVFPQEDGTYQIIIKQVDDALIESLGNDELLEFFGIDTEFAIALEVV